VDGRTYGRTTELRKFSALVTPRSAVSVAAELLLIALFTNVVTVVRKSYWNTDRAASQYYVDAAYCYRRSSVVCLPVGRSVCNSRESCKTAEPIEMPFWLWSGLRPGNHVLDGVQIPLMRMGKFEGEGTAHFKV